MGLDFQAVLLRESYPNILRGIFPFTFDSLLIFFFELFGLIAGTCNGNIAITNVSTLKTHS